MAALPSWACVRAFGNWRVPGYGSGMRVPATAMAAILIASLLAVTADARTSMRTKRLPDGSVVAEVWPSQHLKATCGSVSALSSGKTTDENVSLVITHLRRGNDSDARVKTIISERALAYLDLNVDMNAATMRCANFGDVVELRFPSPIQGEPTVLLRITPDARVENYLEAVD